MVGKMQWIEFSGLDGMNAGLTQQNVHNMQNVHILKHTLYNAVLCLQQ